jgi:DNA-binding NarL/FixJ family response regulator
VPLIWRSWEVGVPPQAWAGAIRAMIAGLRSAMTTTWQAGGSAARGLTGAPLARALLAPVLAGAAPREWEVLQALGEGLSDTQIGEKLHIATETARSHIEKILSKLEVHSRLQALVFAVWYGGAKIT